MIRAIFNSFLTKLYFVSLILFLFTFSNLNGQTINDDVNFFDYTYDQKSVQSSGIKLITIESYIQQKLEGIHKFYFDSLGHLVKQEILDTTMQLQTEFLFYTNNHDHLILRKQMDHALNLKDSVQFVKKYDGNNLIMDSSSQVPTCSYFKYDKNNILVACSTYVGLDNRILRVVNYISDNKAKPVRITEYVYNYGDTTGMLISDKEIVYNSSGKKEKEIEKHNADTFIPLNKGTIGYVYNTKGQLIQKQTKSTTENYKYNASGLLSEKLMTISIDDHTIELNDIYHYQFRK